MVFHNGQFTSKQQIRSFIRTTVLIVFMLLMLFIGAIIREFGYDITFPYIYRYLIMLVAVGVYAFYTYTIIKKKYFYIYVADEDKTHLVFRFYHIKPFRKKHMTYKIPLVAFYSFKIEENQGQKQLVLFQKMKNNKIAKYAPISISSLSKDEIITLTEALQQYSIISKQ